MCIRDIAVEKAKNARTYTEGSVFVTVLKGSLHLIDRGRSAFEKTDEFHHSIAQGALLKTKVTMK